MPLPSVYVCWGKGRSLREIRFLLVSIIPNLIPYSKNWRNLVSGSNERRERAEAWLHECGMKFQAMSFLPNKGIDFRI